MKIILIPLIGAAILSRSLCAGSQVFESPDKSAKVLIDSAEKLGTDWGTESFGEYLSISLSRKNMPLMWVGIAYKDETGVSPEVIWGKSSKTALFLYRPQRGEVVLGVFRPGSTTKFEPILSDSEREKFSLGMDTRPTILTKTWTKDWKEVNDSVFEGDLFIAKANTRSLHLRVDASKFPSVVSVLSQKDGN